MPTRIEGLEQALNANRFKLQHDVDIAGERALVAHRSDFRLRWFATRLHSFVITCSVSSLTTERAEELTAAAQQFSVSHKPGLPRGLQTGTMTFATFICDSSDEELQRWFAAKPPVGFAAMQFPVLADISTDQVTWFGGQRVLGSIYRQHAHRIVKDLIADGLQMRS